MLSWLLKYEFRATSRIMLCVLGALLAIAAAASLGMRAIGYNRGLTIVGAMVLVLYFLAIMCVGAVTLILLIYRFYKSLLSDEGYLIFSLPVGVHSHICCKLICAAVWMLASFAAILLSIAIVASSIGITGVVLSDLQVMFERIAAAWSIGALDFASFALELLLLAELSAVGGCLTFYAAMSFGFSFSEHKALYSVLAYIAIGILTQLCIAALLGALGLLFSLQGPGFYISLGGILNVTRVKNLSHAVMLGGIVLQAAYCAALYAITAYFLKRRLNLP